MSRRNFLPVNVAPQPALQRIAVPVHAIRKIVSLDVQVPVIILGVQVVVWLLSRLKNSKKMRILWGILVAPGWKIPSMLMWGRRLGRLAL